MLTRTQKEEQVTELRDKLGRATSVILADYRGVRVQEVDELRRRLRAEANGDGDSYEYRVTKNTLLRRAVSGSEVGEALAPHFEGPTAVALAFGDPIALAKILVDFSKKHEVFEIKGGLLQGRAVGAEEIATLATLPSLEELRAKLAGLVQAPAQKLATLLATPAGQLARVVEARRAQLEESPGAS